jgi:hypothetical protein
MFALVDANAMYVSWNVASTPLYGAPPIDRSLLVIANDPLRGVGGVPR